MKLADVRQMASNIVAEFAAVQPRKGDQKAIDYVESFFKDVIHGERAQIAGLLRAESDRVAEVGTDGKVPATIALAISLELMKQAHLIDPPGGA